MKKSSPSVIDYSDKKNDYSDDVASRRQGNIRYDFWADVESRQENHEKEIRGGFQNKISESLTQKKN